MKATKMSVFLLVCALTLFFTGSVYAFEHPSWTSVNPDGVKAVSKIDVNGTEIELPTFEEAYAYLDYESAPADVKELILKARRIIVYGDTSWTVDGHVSIIHADGTEEQLPEFKDLYPDWSLEKLSLKSDSGTIDDYAPMAANFGDNVYIPLATIGSNEFYSFNSGHPYTYSWADTLPGDRINIGYRDVDTNRDIGHIANLKVGGVAKCTYSTGVRIAVRCSSYDKAGHGFLNVIGSNSSW